MVVRAASQAIGPPTATPKTAAEALTHKAVSYTHLDVYKRQALAYPEGAEAGEHDADDGFQGVLRNL